MWRRLGGRIHVREVNWFLGLHVGKCHPKALVFAKQFADDSLQVFNVVTVDQGNIFLAAADAI
jgi:hypothetical protein